MAIKRDEFTDRQQAEIFARDRALCCFSGKSLWALDYGGEPAPGPWIDHIKPAARGGRAELDNGACASWLYNKLKRDSGSGMYLFRAGRPTADFFTFYEVVPPAISAHIRRFAALHWSDWYFNRAAGEAKLAAAFISEEQTRQADKTSYTRGPDYWAGASLKWLIKWQKIIHQEKPRNFASRGLLPTNASVDQAILANLASATTIDAVLRIAQDLAPYSLASWNALVDLATVQTAAEAQALLARVTADPHVVPRVRQALEQNISLLYGGAKCAEAGATQDRPCAEVPAELRSVNVLDPVNLYKGDVAIMQDPCLPPAFPETDLTEEGCREIFTIGEKGLATPARLAELVANLGVVHLVDVRTPPPRRGKWTTTELDKLLENRLVTPLPGSDACTVIAGLSLGRILVLGGAKSPLDAPVRLSIGDEHPGWDVMHIYHDQPSEPFAEAQCISHAELARVLAADPESDYEFSSLVDFFVEDIDYSGRHSYTALTFPTSEARDAAADLFGWDQSPWQDGFAFMTDFHAFLAHRALHPDRSPEQLACGAARLVLELVDPVRPGGPRIKDPGTRIYVASYLQQALAQLEEAAVDDAESANASSSQIVEESK
jgi:hypothetical protein